MRRAQRGFRRALLGLLALGLGGAGLFWGLWLGTEGLGVQVFFLLCVLVAGVFGAVTASRKILFIQGLPALVGLGLLWAAT